MGLKVRRLKFGWVMDATAPFAKASRPRERVPTEAWVGEVGFFYRAPLRRGRGRGGPLRQGFEAQGARPYSGLGEIA